MSCDYVARRDPSFELPGSRFATTKFSHVVTSARLSRMQSQLTHKFQKKAFRYISINRRYYQCSLTMYMMSVCEKKQLINVFIEFHCFMKHACKEKSKENVYKSKPLSDGKLSRLAGTKFNFPMESQSEICPC